MVTTIRAAISVGLLAGFYVLALALVAGLAATAIWLWQEGPGGAAAKLSYVAIAVAVGLVVAFWKVVRTKPQPPAGLRVAPEQAPELWSTVRELAREVGTRAPDEIRLIPEVNAAVSEDAGLMGLRAGRRYLFLGVPLLQALTVAQLRAVLAHELGHYSHSHTRLGELSYRGRATIIQTLEQIGPRSLVGVVLKGYAMLYLFAEQAVSRRQEYEADQASIRVAGKAAAASALRELPVLDSAWSFYFNRYVGWGWDAGYVPDDIFGGFRRLVEARGDELARLRAETPPDTKSRWDSHPPIAARIAAIEAAPDVAGTPDQRLSGVLVPDLVGACRALQADAVDPSGRSVLPWTEFTAAAATAIDQREADVLFRAAARLAGARSANLATVLDLVAAGRAAELARAVAPHNESPDEGLAAYVADAVRVAAVRSGAARWEHSWTEPARLVDRSGAPFDATELARLAVSGPVADARVRLAGMGIDPGTAEQVSAEASAVGAEVIAGIANVQVDGSPHDVYVLTNGLVFIACPKDTDGGRDRMLAVAQSASAADLAEHGRFIPYEGIASVAVLKSVPARLELSLHDGRVVKLREAWTGDLLTKNSRDVLLGALGPYVPAG